MYGGVFRRGDVVRFRRGSNEYVGDVVRVHGASDGLEVQAERIGGVRVAMKNVVRVEVPVLTVKERAALLELVPELRGALVSQLNSLRGPRGDDEISGTTMHGLAQRGLVVGERYGMADHGPLTWRLTTEGRRVARL